MIDNNDDYNVKKLNILCYPLILNKSFLLKFTKKI